MNKLSQAIKLTCVGGGWSFPEFSDSNLLIRAYIISLAHHHMASIIPAFRSQIYICFNYFVCSFVEQMLYKRNRDSGILKIAYDYLFFPLSS